MDSLCKFIQLIYDAPVKRVSLNQESIANVAKELAIPERTLRRFVQTCSSCLSTFAQQYASLFCNDRYVFESKDPEGNWFQLSYSSITYLFSHYIFVD